MYSLLGYYRRVADVVIVPWRISDFVCSGAAVTEWGWDYKPLIHCIDSIVDIVGHSSPWNKRRSLLVVGWLAFNDNDTFSTIRPLNST